MSVTADPDGLDRAGAPAPWAPLAAALRAYESGDRAATLTVRNDADSPRSLPVSHFFREPIDFSAIDREAMGRCTGRVLDVGAAAGAVALPLQQRGLDVTALDPVPEAVRIMRERGVLDARLGNVMAFTSAEPFDTVLLLMNGSMIAGTVTGLEQLLLHLETLLSPGGQVLMDSTDLRDGSEVQGPDGRYVGELHYQLEFEGNRGPPFPQLFVDPHALTDVASRVGLGVDIVAEGEDGAFLARIARLREAAAPGSGDDHSGDGTPGSVVFSGRPPPP